MAKKLAIVKGTDVNVRDNSWGFTALHYASEYGRKGIARMLAIEAGADVNARDYS